jgi:peptidyl-tRNA hydrolase
LKQKTKCLSVHKQGPATKAAVVLAWKKHTSKQVNLKKKLIQMHENVTNVNLRDAFDCIAHRRDIVKYSRESSKLKSQHQILNLVTRLNLKNTKYWFNRFYENGKTNNQKNDQIKQIFKKQMVKFYREAFEKWKKTAEMKEVVRFNNQEGPQQIELQKIRQDIHNLKKMLREEMIYTEEQCQELIDKDNERTEHLLNKSRVRWGRFGDG